MRHTASIVIPAWNEWELTRACLESLRPTLGVRDQVVVVDNGSTDGTAAGLRRYPWVQVVSHAENLGFAAGCNSGAAVATGEVVVFLNNDTLVPSRWLDGLLRPFRDRAVGATGPRSNFVSGPQLVEEVAYDVRRRSELSAFARDWREAHRGRTTETTRLVGFCLAVRRSTLERLGGFDEGFGLGGCEDDDLCLRIAASGERLLITHESFVHHHGHRTFEANGVDWYALQVENTGRLQTKHGDEGEAADGALLLSACLIVKDEQDALPSCLESLRGVVDEIVVYDTGSTDATRELAAAAGALVVEGFWDDDFSRARNSALAACSGRWILHVDADEQLVGDPAALRRELSAVPAPGALQLVIDNVESDGSLAFAHTAVRLFQRLRGHWEGRLHEQVVARDGTPLQRTETESVRIRHTGYSEQALEAGRKKDRNLRVARAGVEGAGGKDPQALLNVARALTSSGAYDEALDAYRRARDATTDAQLLRHVLRSAAEALLDAGRPEQALPWITDFRRYTGSASMPDYLEGTAHLALGDTDRALALLEGVAEAKDEDFAIAPRLLRLRRGLSFVGSERWSEAAVELTAVVVEHGVPAWGQLVHARWRAGEAVTDLVAHVPADKEVAVLAQLLLGPAPAADLVAEALWHRCPGSARLIAFALQIGVHLPLERALEWSARIRAAGVADACPLLAVARSETAAPLESLQAAAVALGAFDDGRAKPALASASARVEVADLRTALLLVDQLAPTCLTTFLRGAASTPQRQAAVDLVLEELGVADQVRELLGTAAG